MTDNLTDEQKEHIEQLSVCYGISTEEAERAVRNFSSPSIFSIWQPTDIKKVTERFATIIDKLTKNEN